MFSGGQRQRVCLAMALYRLESSQNLPEQASDLKAQESRFSPAERKAELPTIMLLDEATSSLDADTELRVLLNLQKVGLHLWFVLLADLTLPFGRPFLAFIFPSSAAFTCFLPLVPHLWLACFSYYRLPFFELHRGCVVKRASSSHIVRRPSKSQIILQ